MRRFVLFLAAALLCGGVLLAQSGVLPAQSNVTACNMTLYPDQDLPALSPAPQGYELFYLNHFGRHGSRTISSSHVNEITLTWSALQQASGSGELSSEGQQLFLELDKVFKENITKTGHLTQRGITQHQGIARRMAANFPELIKDGSRIDVVTSIWPRCIMSMSAFTNALTSAVPGVQYSFACSPTLQCTFNPYIPKAIKKGAQKAEKFVDMKQGYDPSVQVGRFFTSKKVMRKYVQDCDAFLYGLCQMYNNAANIDIEADLRPFVDPQVYAYYMVRSNRVIYYQSCNSAEFGPTRMALADTMAFSMVSKMDKAIAGAGPDVDLCFGHDYGLNAYLSMLDAECVPAGMSADQIDKRFDSSKVIPMAANLQQLFYRNAEGDVLVKFVLNEHEIRLHGLAPVEGVYYKWADVRTRLAGFAVARGSFQDIK